MIIPYKSPLHAMKTFKWRQKAKEKSGRGDLEGGEWMSVPDRMEKYVQKPPMVKELNIFQEERENQCDLNAQRELK